MALRSSDLTGGACVRAVGSSSQLLSFGARKDGASCARPESVPTRTPAALQEDSGYRLSAWRFLTFVPFPRAVGNDAGLGEFREPQGCLSTLPLAAVLRRTLARVNSNPSPETPRSLLQATLPLVSRAG
ncbi:hypothetical protein NN561_007750 [Cricetulus griseus]